MKTKITVLTGLPGCGKTQTLIQNIVAAPGKYLFATSRIELLEERGRDIEVAAAAAGVELRIVAIHSNLPDRRTVARRIEDAPTEFAEHEHVVLLVTHEGLMSADLSGFQRWHARLDEPPAGILSDTLRIPALTEWFARRYSTENDGGKWPRVVTTAHAPSIADLAKDQCMSSLVPFAKRVGSPSGVRLDPDLWETFSSTGSLAWISAWTPYELRHCESVVLAGSGFMTSLSFRAMLKWHGAEIEVREKPVGTRIGSDRPTVHVHYFTEHRGSTMFWSKQEGRQCLNKVADFLANVLTIDYWSGNECVTTLLEGRVPGQLMSPKLEGTNSLRDKSCCAFIYSAKALPADAAARRAFDLSRQDIERARELEDIIQFVFRGAIRDPSFAGTYDVYLYDFAQAEGLARYLKDCGWFDVELTGIPEAGIMDVVRFAAGRPKIEETDNLRSAQEKIERRRAQDCERQRRKRARDRLEPKRTGPAPGP